MLLKFASAMCLAAMVVFSGCNNGPKLVPVSGSITVNSKPAEGALIYFHPSSETEPTASGVAAADGSFEPMTNGEKGLFVGSYKVTVIWPDPSKKPTPAQLMMGTAEVGPDLLKGKYAAKKDTTLNVEVKSDTKTIPAFNL
jgi:hypothetical protein